MKGLRSYKADGQGCSNHFCVEYHPCVLSIFWLPRYSHSHAPNH